VFPWIGKRPISEITAPELLTVLRRIEHRALEAAHPTRQTCGQVFRYAIATGRAERDPSADLKGRLLAPNNALHSDARASLRKLAPRRFLRSLGAERGRWAY
jgi:hypothetical protein